MRAELCLVSSETFFPSVREATDYVGPDWEKRRALQRESDEKRQGMPVEVRSPIEALVGAEGEGKQEL